MKRTAASLVVAALVLLAGCAGGIAGPNGAQTADGENGTVQFYVSDEQNAISQFEHLNVTVTSVGFAQTSVADANASTDADVETESEGGLQVGVVGNVTAGGNATVQVTHDGDVVENATVEAGDGDATVTTDANGTATVAVPADGEEFSVSASTDEDSEFGEAEAELEVEFDEDGESETEWVERDVDNRSVDLTELQGANATLLGNMSLPAGEYEKVFVHVGEVEGTLKTGEQVNVKLPSQKLHLNEDFTVNQSSDVEFVFDITAFEAGNSEKYILKPVASESGTDVPIERVDVEADEDGLEANFVGDVTAGENATVQVTQDGDPVENATVTVNEDVTVTTDANGTASVSVPAAAEEFELEAETAEGSAYGEAEAELELDLGESDSDDGDSDDSETELGAVLEGSLAPGENATVVATDGEGEAVEDATVAVDGEVVGETNEDGELTFAVPEDASLDTEMTVTSDGETVTLDSTTAAAAN